MAEAYFSSMAGLLLVLDQDVYREIHVIVLLLIAKFFIVNNDLLLVNNNLREKLVSC